MLWTAGVGVRQFSACSRGCDSLTWMRVAILTTDNREQRKQYRKTTPDFGAAPEALLQGFRRDAETEVHVISCARARMESPEKLGPNIFFHSIYVPRIGWMQTLYQGCARSTRQVLRRIQPDIVHGQGTERDCAMSAVLSGFPNVVTIHGNMRELTRMFASEYGLFGWLATRLEDYALRRTAGVFCNSEYTESLVRPRARRTWRVPNPIREEFFRSSSHPGPFLAGEGGPIGESRKGAGPVLINVGAVTSRKRQLELLNMARELHQEGLVFQLWFVGSAVSANPYAARFLEEVSSGQQERGIRYLGVKNTEDLIRLFDEASALVHFPMEEAFGLVVAEALARGVKLFGTRTGGISEIASGVSDAELFEANDWSRLKRRVAAWVRAGAPRSGAGSELMCARYHPDHIAKLHLEIYREVTHSERTASSQIFGLTKQ